jgi:hypothetical protein
MDRKVLHNISASTNKCCSVDALSCCCEQVGCALARTALARRFDSPDTNRGLRWLGARLQWTGVRCAPGRHLVHLDPVFSESRMESRVKVKPNVKQPVALELRPAAWGQRRGSAFKAISTSVGA